MHSHERFLVNNYYEVAMRPKIRGRLIRETAMAPNDSGVEYTTLQYVSIRNKMWAMALTVFAFNWCATVAEHDRAL